MRLRFYETKNKLFIISVLNFGMKKYLIAYTLLVCSICFSSMAYNQTSVSETKAADAKAKSDLEQEKKAAEWVASLNLNDAAKEARVKELIATHLKTIRDWHNEH